MIKKSLLIAHVALFSFGYSFAVFALPPFFTSLGSDQLFLGEYGFLLMLPNVVLPLIFSKLKNLNLTSKLIILSTIIVDISIIFFTFERSFSIYLFLVLVLGIGQFMWWITTEIFFTGISRGTNLINVYSIVWGASYLISPIFAGYFIPLFGYPIIFVLSFIFIFISIILFVGSIKNEKFNSVVNQIQKHGNKILIESFFPSFVTGLSIGLLSSIFPGYVLKSGINVLGLGVLTAMMSLARLIGFLYLINKLQLQKLKFLMDISFILLLIIIIPAFTMNYYALLVMMLVIGFSSSLGISAPLIYISNNEDANISRNIAVYEFSFGISVSAFALIFGYVSQDIGIRIPYIIDFIITFALSIFFILKKYK